MTNSSIDDIYAPADLSNRVVVVTGAGRGMGRATASLAASAGAHVIAADVAGHDETAETITSNGGRAEGVRLDITDSAQWEAVVSDVIARHGRIDALANIAGIVDLVDTLLDQTEEGWERMLRVDLKGAWLGMRAVVPHMLDAGGGKIVNVASAAALVGMSNVMAYSAAKGGVVALSRQVAVEYAPKGLRVNSIAPGVIDTPMLGGLTVEQVEGVKAATPSARMGEATDVASMIVYLLGSGSDFVTGQVFPVDGGWTAW